MVANLFGITCPNWRKLKQKQGVVDPEVVAEGGIPSTEVARDSTLDPPPVPAALDPDLPPVRAPAPQLQPPAQVWLLGGGSSDPVTYGWRAKGLHVPAVARMP